MEKLSKAQSKLLQDCINECVFCRNVSLNEYLYKKYKEWTTKINYGEWLKSKDFGKTTYEQFYTKKYNDIQKGQFYLMGVNKRTVRKLIELGYIIKFESNFSDEIIWLNLEKCGIE